MAGDLDLAGRIILEDAFSRPLADLQKGAQAGEAALQGMGAGADQAVQQAAGRIAELRQELAGLQQQGATGGLGANDLEALQRASGELQTIERELNGLKPLDGMQAGAQAGEAALAGLAAQIDRVSAKQSGPVDWGQMPPSYQKTIDEFGQMEAAAQNVANELAKLPATLNVQPAAQAGAEAMAGLGQAADQSTKLASQRIAELNQELEGIRQRASGGELSIGDLTSYRKASSELQAIERQMAGLKPLQDLQTGAQAGTAALTGLGQAADRSLTLAAERVAELKAQLAGLQQKALAGGLSVGDLDSFKQAAGELQGIERQMGALGQTGEQALTGLGQAADRTTRLATERVAELKQQLASLQQKSLTGTLSVGDLSSYKSASSELQGLERQLASLGKAGNPLAQGGAAAGLGSQTAGVRQFVGEVMGGIPGLGQFAGLVGTLAGPAAMGLLAVEAGKVALELGQMGMESRQVEARFTAFSGGAAAAEANLAAMNATLGLSLTQDEKMAAVSHIMSLELANSGSQAAQVAEEALILGDAHASAEQRIASFTQMLATGQTRGLAAYGINLQQVKQRAEEMRLADDNLTAQQATTNAILELAAQKVAEVKAAGGSATTATQDFTNAWNDLKDAVAEKVAPTIEVVVKGATGVVQGLIVNWKATPEEQAVTEARNQLAQATEAVTNREKELKVVKDAGMDTGSQDRALAEANINKQLAQTAYDKAMGYKAAAEGAKFAAQAVDTHNLAMGNDVRTQQIFAVAEERNTDALRAFNDAAGTGANAKPFELWAGQMGAAAKQLKELAAGATNMPEMPKNLLAFKQDDWQAWLTAMAESDQALQKPAQKLSDWAMQLNDEQQKLIAAALAANTHAEGLEILARGAGVADGSIAGLVAQYANLNPQVQAAIDQLGGFNAAVAELSANAAKPVTVDVKVKNAQQMLDQVDGMALSLTGMLSPQRINAWRDRARQAVLGMYQGMGTVTEFGLKALDAQLSNSLQKEIDMRRDAAGVVEADARAHYSRMTMQANEASSLIESALKRGLQVTDTQMFQTKGGLYKDVALESAKQLDDIAQHGREAISRHKDWITKFGIPEPLMAPNPEAENQLKAWAAGMRDQVTNLERPDLIDWGAFAESFKQQVGEGIGKDATLTRAVSELKARIGIDLPKMSDEEIKAKVAEMLGMKAPEVPFKAMFETEADAKLKIAQQVLAGDPAIQLPYALVPQPGTDKAGPQTPYPPAESKYGAAPAVPVTKPTGPVSLEAAQAAGQAQTLPPNVGQDIGTQLAADMLAGLDTAARAQKPASLVAGYWTTDFMANQVLFQGLGTSAGGTIATALVTALDQGIGDVLGRIASRVAPEVAAILRRGQGAYSLDGTCR